MTENRGVPKSSPAPDDPATDLVQPDAQGGVSSPVQDPVVRRTKDGWRVGDSDVADLISAMALADLLASEASLASADEAADPAAAKAAAAASGGEPVTGDTGKLRATIGQLEHALTARIRVEQAIGVLAERHRIQPRQAFEQLRAAARSRGRRVIDIASDVVASATNPLLQLPEELSRPRSVGRATPRGPRRPHGILGSE